jgi:c-di-AMP phosphodiesterase-like protein
VDVGVEPNVIESSSNQQPARKQSRRLAKRRALKSQKSDRIDEIRGIVGMGHRVSKLDVLNTGAGIWLIAVIGLAIHRPHLF